MNYSQWYAALDRLCYSSFGMSHEDMPDLTLIRDLFESGCTPTDAFEICCDAWADDDPIFRDVLMEGFF